MLGVLTLHSLIFHGVVKEPSCLPVGGSLVDVGWFWDRLGYNGNMAYIGRTMLGCLLGTLFDSINCTGCDVPDVSFT